MYMNLPTQSVAAAHLRAGRLASGWCISSTWLSFSSRNQKKMRASCCVMTPACFSMAEKLIDVYRDEPDGLVTCTKDKSDTFLMVGCEALAAMSACAADQAQALPDGTAVACTYNRKLLVQVVSFFFLEPKGSAAEAHTTHTCRSSSRR